MPNLSIAKPKAMAKVKEDKSRVRLEIDGKQAVNELSKLEMEAKQLQIDLKNAKRGTDEYIAANTKLADVKNKITAVRKELGLTGMTMSQLVRHQRDLRNELNNTTTAGTQRYKELQIQIQKVNAAINQQRAELNGTAGFFSKIGKEIKAFGLVALGYLGAGAFLGQVQSMVEGSAKLSDELSDVQKTTGLADNELAQLSETLKNMDTRTARSELRGLAEIAGRLGLKGVKDIEGFVNAADKINVALGDVLGDPEKVMRELGKLTSTFGVTKEFGIEDALLKVGSAINELGMASTANEGYLVEFSKRMGGIAPLANISIENILGLGATLDSLGQTSEVSSTALSKLFIGMAKNAEAFAKQAQMPVQDFVKLLNEDANEAFLRVLEGVKGNSAGLVELAATLGDVGQDGGRVVGVLGTLANNTETLRKQQEISNRAFKEGISVVNEFNLKNENMAANLAKVQKWLAGLFVNSSIMNGLNEVVSLWAKWVQVPLSKTLEEERIELNKMQIQLTSASTSTEDRVKLINQLKQKYPGYLGNINAEKVSNQELSKAIKAVNDQLVNKIILQSKEEEIANQNERIARQRMNLMKEEDKLRTEMTKVAEKFNLKIFEGLSLEDQARTLTERAKSFDNLREGRDGKLIGDTSKLIEILASYRKTQENLNLIEQEGNFLLDEKNRLIERLGINLEEAGSTSDFVIPDDPKDNPFDPTPDPEVVKGKQEDLAKLYEAFQSKLQKIRREYELSQMQDEQRDKERLNDKYLELELELTSHFEKKAISEIEYTERLKEIAELREQDLALITDKYREAEAIKKEEAERKITEATISERELAELKIKQHYDVLLDLARQYGIDQAGIIAARSEALAQLNQKYQQQEIQQEADKYEAKKQMAMEFASVATGVMGLVANFSGEVGKYDRTMAISKAALASGEAIANMVKMFSATSFTPIDLAAKIAAGTGIILANINSAIRTVNRTNIPESPETPDVKSIQQKRRGSTAVKRSYFKGGETSDIGMGFGDKFGEFVGYVHKNEYVIPEMLTSHPWVANVIPAIEAIRKEKTRGFAVGGPTSENMEINTNRPKLNEFASDPEIKELLKSMVLKLDMMPKQIRAYLVYNDLEEMQEEMETLKSRYRA